MPFSDSEAVLLTLTTIAFDLQIRICTFLHPSDILALRKTCKDLQFTTRQRIVWIDALRRVCVDNALFIPSFPMLNMSNIELEQAAMAPRRWINLCSASAKQQRDNSGAMLSPTGTRNIHHSIADSSTEHDSNEVFLVPGGRYLVASSFRGIGVWDLGCTSSADCKLLASVGPEGGSSSCMVNATSDGMGLIIVAFCRHKHCAVYKIYPQSETPQLTLISYLPIGPRVQPPVFLLHNRVVWYTLYDDRIVFRVWDYELNHSISFSTEMDVEGFDYYLEVIATSTAVIALCEEGILVWGIPPLSPQAPDFLDKNPTHIPLLFRVPFPGDLVCKKYLNDWKMISNWYSGSSQPLYFDAFCRDLKLYGFEIVIEPDLSDASLRIMNISQLTLSDHLIIQPYSICEDNLVSCWHIGVADLKHCKVHVRTNTPSRGPTSTVLNILLPNTRNVYSTLSSCPASGRFVHLDKTNCNLVVADFLPCL